MQSQIAIIVGFQKVDKNDAPQSVWEVSMKCRIPHVRKKSFVDFELLKADFGMIGSGEHSEAAASEK
jgi:hypothetical protein